MRSRCVGCAVSGRSCVVLVSCVISLVIVVSGGASSPGGGDSGRREDVIGGSAQKLLGTLKGWCRLGE